MRSIMRKTKSSEAPTEWQERADKNMEKAFELPQESAAMRIFRRNDRGQLKILDVLSLSTVSNPDELISILQDRWGGGQYYILPTVSGRKAGDGFSLEFDGQPKEVRKEKVGDEGNRGGGRKTDKDKELEELRQRIRDMEQKEREDHLVERVREEIQAVIPKSSASKDLMESLLSNFPQVVTGLAGIVGNRESASDMLEKISSIWRNIETSMPKLPDPVEQAKAMAELIFNIVNQSRPPVVTSTGAASGGFWASFLDQLAQLAQKFTGWTPAQQLQQPTAPVFAQVQPSGGFSGIPQQAAAPQGQPAGAISALSLATLVEDPVARLREMLRLRYDPDDIAQIVVYLIDFIGSFSRPGNPYLGYINGFLADPEAGFDRIVPYIPELHGADPQYVARLRNSIIEAVEDYLVQLRRQQGEPISEPSQRKERPLNIEDLLGREAEAQKPKTEAAATADEDDRDEKDEAAVLTDAD